MIINILKTEDEFEKFLDRKGKSIFFVHNAKSVEQIAPFRKILNERHCIIIPTSPEPLFILDELKLPYRIPEDYYTPEENYNYTESLEPKIINLVEEIDQTLQEFYPKIKQSGLKIAFYHLYPLVRSYSSLANVYFKIKKIIRAEQPNKIGLFIEKRAGGAKDSKPNRALESWLLWESNENLFQKVLNAYQSNLSVYSVVSNKVNQFGKDSSFRNNWKSKVKTLVRNRPRLYYVIRMLRKNGLSTLPMLFYQQFELKPLLLLNGGYDWDQCHRELYKRGYYIWSEVNDSLENWYRENSNASQLSKNILEKLENSSTFRDKFKEDKIDFYPLLKNKINLFLEKVVPASLSAYQKICQLIKKKQIKGLLFSINPTAISKSIARAAQKSGVPVIGWQHGDMNCKPIPSIILNDLLTADLFLSWGKGASRNRTEIADKLKLKRKQREVGSPNLDKLIFSPGGNRYKVLEKIGIRIPKQPIVIYASTMYYLSNTHNFSYPPWSDNYIYNTQKKITNRLVQLKGTKIIKLHPNLFYALPALDAYWRSFKEQNVWTIRNEIAAISLFSIADVIIVDLPTTTILQAIACKKPIFSLTRHLQLEKKTKELLQKRVVLTEDPEDLMGEVEFFINSGKYKADLQNTEFLETFGTLPDCRAAERAARAVDELIESAQIFQDKTWVDKAK